VAFFPSSGLQCRRIARPSAVYGDMEGLLAAGALRRGPPKSWNVFVPKRSPKDCAEVLFDGRLVNKQTAAARV
jgi:hypothetical protein